MYSTKSFLQIEKKSIGKQSDLGICNKKIFFTCNQYVQWQELHTAGYLKENQYREHHENALKIRIFRANISTPYSLEVVMNRGKWRVLGEFGRVFGEFGRVWES